MLPELKFVDKVGVELEGGWMRTFPDIQIGHDISVQRPDRNVNPTSARECSCGEEHNRVTTCHWGEIPSPPLTLKEILPWLKEHFPDGVNNSCGFHVHASMKYPLYYSQLIDKRFYDTFLRKAKEWGKSEDFPPDHLFWDRLNNKDPRNPNARFCNRPFAASRQIVLTDKPELRRSALNYCYAMHGTLECRLFPALSDVKVAARAVIFYITTIEEWLAARPEEKPDLLVVKRIKDLAQVRDVFKPLKG